MPCKIYLKSSVVFNILEDRNQAIDSLRTAEVDQKSIQFVLKDDPSGEYVNIKPSAIEAISGD